MIWLFVVVCFSNKSVMRMEMDVVREREANMYSKIWT